MWHKGAAKAFSSLKTVCLPRSRTVPFAATEQNLPTVEEKNALTLPEWMPAQVSPVVSFLDATDFDIKEWSVYKNKLAAYLEDPTIQQLYGFKPVAETIHGRLSMLGFVSALMAEVLGAGSIANQLAAGQTVAFLVSLAVVVASCVPIVKGAKGGYMESLRETYTIPDGLFTESLERVHGRLAMLGLSGLLLIEVVKGSAVF
eukprot:TRINITY_DN8354_c0_g1_i2.p2 TRINITY_DN8354_c0_g1~~TRINITY_DN8354_c0_g1_i2.p2  ORF type:complete len:228 (+),score=23.09 TRINITY_DN8354_c0_g1_i2:79-684(+)